MNYDQSQDPRNQANRLHLNFGANERSFQSDVGRAFPTTPSAFPQPVYPQANGQQEVWGTGTQTPSAYPGGPPSYFVSHVQLQPQYQQGPNMPPPAAFRSPAPMSPSDGTNGLVHQFSNQNLGASIQRTGSPYNRAASPGMVPARPSTGNRQQQSGGQTPNTPPAPPAPGSNGESLPDKDPGKYSQNIYLKGQVAVNHVGLFFRESVQRARDRNQRAKELVEIYRDPNLSDKKKEQRRLALIRGEAQYLRFMRTRLTPDDYSTVKVIGKGAFGEVKLVRHRRDENQIYALKSLVKSEMFKRDQLAHVRAERDILAESNSPWVVRLHTSFQDDWFLYMLMEYLPGGDLMTMLIKYEIFSEDITRFYMAELVLAIDAVHALGFIHRDIKPDNILIDAGGHIKLTDFGLSTGFHKEHDQSYYQQLMNGPAHTSKRSQNRNSVAIDQISLTVSNRQTINTWRKEKRRELAYSTVGTPDYIAPEIFTGRGYSFGCDWWSVGTIMFECLIGWPPFCAEESTDTYRKIVDWPRHLHFPPDQKLHPDAENLIRSLITDPSQRIGRKINTDGSGGGAAEIMRHSFFRGVEWQYLRRINAPFKPNLTSKIDTQYFPVDEIPQEDSTVVQKARIAQAEAAREGRTAADMALPFVGYTYKRFEAQGPGRRRMAPGVEE